MALDSIKDDSLRGLEGLKNFWDHKQENIRKMLWLQRKLCKKFIYKMAHIPM